MKVSKVQVQANRARIVETASALFRERGYDGVGVAELMAAAGFTHGGFYKHFGSKADLMREAAVNGLSQSIASNESLEINEFFKYYLSRKHRDCRSGGCTMAALSGDAARQSEDLKAAFATGIEDLLTALQPESAADTDQHEARAKVLDMLTRAVGAIVLSRACPDDSPLADEILQICRAQILEPLPHKSSN